MYRTKALVFLFVILSSTLGSQTDWRIGITAGLNASELTGNEFFGYRKAGIIAGFSGRRHLVNPRWHFQGNLLYSQKGEQRNPKPEEGDLVRYYLATHFVEAQALWRYELKRFHLTAGPGLGYLLGYRERDILGNVNDPRRMSPVDFTGTIGMSFPLDEHWHAELRWTNSLIPVRKHLSGQTFLLNFGQFNTLISFLINWHPSFHKKEPENVEKISE